MRHLPPSVDKRIAPREGINKIVPAYPGDPDWDYPPEIKAMISLLAKKAALDYLKTTAKS